jgi:hypothetical protein
MMQSMTAQLLQKNAWDLLKETKIGMFLADIVGHIKKNLAAVPFLDTVGSICQLPLTGPIHKYRSSGRFCHYGRDHVKW